MGIEAEKKTDRVQGTLLKIDFLTFGRITVSLPLGSLFFCFITAVLFKFDEVNKTVCEVQNLIPSISAITGVSPQRYIWRVCIALHATPRILVGFLYWRYYMDRLWLIKESQRGWYKRLVRVNFWLYIVENACLIGVTYIANVDNYPVHEKIFVVFMVTSLLYELMTIILFRWAHPEMEKLKHISRSYLHKKIGFLLNMTCTAGLVVFFIRHRFFCEPGAFSWFSAFEYGIAITNICCHYTATNEFGGYKWYVGIPEVDEDNNGTVVKNHHYIAKQKESLQDIKQD